MFSPKVLRTDPLSEQMTISELFCFLSEMESTQTHCILNRLSHTIYWKSLISILGTSGYEIYILLEKNGQTVCKQWRPWSDTAFCGVWSGSALFANYPFTGLPITMIKWDKGKNLLPFFRVLNHFSEKDWFAGKLSPLLKITENIQ